MKYYKLENTYYQVITQTEDGFVANAVQLEGATPYAKFKAMLINNMCYPSTVVIFKAEDEIPGEQYHNKLQIALSLYNENI